MREYPARLRRLSGIFASLVASALPLSGTSAAQQELPTPGDTYLISRDRGGEFTGSHKIYPSSSDGLYQVTYCGRAYYVLPYTVAWTQLEVENKRAVKVEYNFGKGWRPLCDNPDQQVTLANLGIALDAAEVVAAYRRLAEDPASSAPSHGGNRFSAISKAFREKPEETGNSSASGSYHAN